MTMAVTSAPAPGPTTSKGRHRYLNDPHTHEEDPSLPSADAHSRVLRGARLRHSAGSVRLDPERTAAVAQGPGERPMGRPGTQPRGYVSQRQPHLDAG